VFAGQKKLNFERAQISCKGLLEAKSRQNNVVGLQFSSIEGRNRVKKKEVWSDENL
jgi:hypothetical protein